MSWKKKTSRNAQEVTGVGSGLSLSVSGMISIVFQTAECLIQELKVTKVNNLPELRFMNAVSFQYLSIHTTASCPISGTSVISTASKTTEEEDHAATTHLTAVTTAAPEVDHVFCITDASFAVRGDVGITNYIVECERL